ncbi:lysyl oxidase [Lysobacter ruishenii]|uniref:Lysyl oxidase n=2 Tax=Aerolutibacter ruishenii TaxID=686800 RepID=A0A562M3D8_9GAMM|nr:lysyl oxidase [Lysobacter ruishenii]
MNPHPLRMRAPWRAAAIIALASGAGAVAAQTAMPPNLVPRGAGAITLTTDSGSRSTLRFSTTSWNAGVGPLELAAGDVETGSGKLQVYQVVYQTSGPPDLRFAGAFEYHPAHEHMHFNDFALYTLQPVNAPGGSSRTGVKTTFCVMDTTPINLGLPGAPGRAFYTQCGRDLQGISVGWGDTYGAHLAGQEIDFTGNADGIYQLKIEVDPKKVLLETNENDNVSCVLLSIRKPSTATVLDSSGQCSSVASITPSSTRTGTTVQVAITGYGFAPGMGVTFDGGTGPRPVASNVQLASDTETVDLITATVTVPYKKQPGKRPVWSVRVGGGGVLANAFTVTP